VRRVLCPENIYTMKLTRRGHRIPSSLHANMFLVRTARDVMDRDFLVMPADTGLEVLAERYPQGNAPRAMVLTRGARIAGMLRIDDALRALHGVREPRDAELDLARLRHRRFIVARGDDVMFAVINRMNRRGAETAVVVDGSHRVPRAGDVIGVITRDAIAESVARSLAFRSEPEPPAAPGRRHRGAEQ